MKNYTEEQLSRILTAHAGGQLVGGGLFWSLGGPGLGCANQFAYNEVGTAVAQRLNPSRASMFDRMYNVDLSYEALLKILEWRASP
jgi:hypothetical protein